LRRVHLFYQGITFSSRRSIRIFRRNLTVGIGNSFQKEIRHVIPQHLPTKIV
jgi:hypothetical protein